MRLSLRGLRAGYGEHLFNEIARDVISADIAVFETSTNSNVMIEMGVALTWGRRVLPIKKKGARIPSDISGQTSADYDSNTYHSWVMTTTRTSSRWSVGYCGERRVLDPVPRGTAVTSGDQRVERHRGLGHASGLVRAGLLECEP